MSEYPRTRKSIAKTRFKYMPCRSCGKRMRVGSNKRNLPQCYDCSIARTVQNAIELHNHSGPAYERWRKAMIEAAIRLGGVATSSGQMVEEGRSN